MTITTNNHRPSSFSCTALLFMATLLLCFAVAGKAQAEDVVCVQCHSGLEAPYSTPVNLWRQSIHAENGIACNGCHGGDPNDRDNAMDPNRGFLGVPEENKIPAFCGRCHVGVLEDFLASAHGHALGDGGPTCVTCHGNHRVLKASLDLINEQTCTQCHSFERAKLIHEAMAKTEARIVDIDGRIAAFMKTGFDTETLEKNLFSIRNSFHSLSHELNTEKVTAAASRIGAELAKIETGLEELTTIRHHRRLVGLLLVSAMLVTALLLHQLRKTYE